MRCLFVCFLSFLYRKESIAFELSSNLSVVLLWKGEELPTAEIVYAAIILLFVYILIIFEVKKFTCLIKPTKNNKNNIKRCLVSSINVIFSLQLVHRTLAAILGSLAAIAALSLFDKVSIKKMKWFRVKL